MLCIIPSIQVTGGEISLLALKEGDVSVAEKKYSFSPRINRDELIERARQGWLVPGFIPEEQFWLLVGASSMRSDKVVNALLDYLVNGLSRKDACVRYDVNSGHFSIGLNRLQQLSHTAAKLSKFYQL